MRRRNDPSTPPVLLHLILRTSTPDERKLPWRYCWLQRTLLSYHGHTPPIGEDGRQLHHLGWAKADHSRPHRRPRYLRIPPALRALRPLLSNRLQPLGLSLQGMPRSQALYVQSRVQPVVEVEQRTLMVRAQRTGSSSRSSRRRLLAQGVQASTVEHLNVKVARPLASAGLDESKRRSGLAVRGMRRW